MTDAPDLDADDGWRRLLDGLDEPAVGQLAEAVADARELSIGPAYERVVGALNDGPLVERDDGGLGTVELADEHDHDHDTDESGDPGETRENRQKSAEETGTRHTNPGERAGETRSPTADSDDSTEGDGTAVVHDAVEFFHEQLDRTIDDHTGGGDHPERPDTAREWFTDVRGFEPETLDDARLGYAPAGCRDELVAYLFERGHGRDDLRASGLFTEGLDRTLWAGRYVFPYFDEQGRAVYAIARCTGSKGGGAAGYDGHPADYLAGKYAKPATTREHVDVEEPIFGVPSLDRDGPVLITEGIADAIRAHEHGYACLSPVTTTFKHEHREHLVEILEGTDRRVYLVQDAERPAVEFTEEVDGWDALAVDQFGPGIKGAVATAAFLVEHDVDTYVAELPRPGLDKVDLDDYLGGWADTLAPVLATATPPEQHAAHTPDRRRDRRDKPRNPARDADGKHGPESSESGGGRELTREQVESALEHVSRSLSYDDWLQLAFAVHDWDSGPTGRRVFENWSKKSPKWSEPTSPDAIDWVWSNARQGGDTTVATLIHRAKRGGWEPPRRARGGDSAPESDENDAYTPGAERRRDATDVWAVVDVRRAWDAAAAVTPADLDEPLELPERDDGDGWRAGDVSIDGVARAVAVADGLVATPDATLDGNTYSRAYQRARERYGAPLPRFLTTQDAVESEDLARAAVRELTFHELDETAFEQVEVTADGSDAGRDAALALDPSGTWRESESGESVKVYPSGTIVDYGVGEHGDYQVVDPLRLVAADAGLVDDVTEALPGDTFEAAYRLARNKYGAPLPAWELGAADHTPVLPAPDQVAESLPEREQNITDLRERVEAVYGDLATDSDGVDVLAALPALGKTTAAIKRAADGTPTAYLAPRKELMKQAEEKAEKWGATYEHLPVFSNNTIDRDVLAQAAAAVRRDGKDALRDPFRFFEGLDGGGGDIFDDDEPEEGDESDDVELDRHTCPTAEGAHGDAWALAVHVARELDFSPRDIHERAEAIFGTGLPCQSDEHGDDSDECPYSTGWERARNPDDPPDLLVGHYTHAHVESARTEYTRAPDGTVKREPRAVVLDEFPGAAYVEEFGDAAPEHARWLAAALDDDVDDIQDMLERDVWADPWVRAWLTDDVDFDADNDRVRRAARAAATLDARADLADAADTADEILDGYTDLLREHELDGPTATLADADGLPGDDERRAACEILDAVGTINPDTGGFGILQWLAADAAEPVDQAPDDTLEPGALPASGDLLELVERAVESGQRPVCRDAALALRGGEEGCRALAAHATDGYAHRRAHYLLRGAVQPDDDEHELVDRIHTEQHGYGERQGDGTVLKHVAVGDKDTVLWDRNQHGAEILRPPRFEAGNGEPCPVVGLDATARAELWRVALGEPVNVRDIHDSPRERAATLRDVHDLQVVQTSEHIKSYEGDPSGKDLDGDVALVQQIADQYTGVHAPRDRHADAEQLGDPAVISTKTVKEVLKGDERLDGVAGRWDNYGNLKGANDLADERLAALLGCQHYGDDKVERFAALDGDQVERQGYGHELTYGSPVADEYLGHMRDDQVMQAALRFARGDSGAVVFAHTAALRDDLPVVGRGQVLRSYNETATRVAREWQRHPSDEFTVADVADAVDVTRRRVQQILDEFVQAGYLERHDTGPGRANIHEPVESPGAGDVELDAELDTPSSAEPRKDRSRKTYTGSFGVHGGDSDALPAIAGDGPTLAPPDEFATASSAPPGD